MECGLVQINRLILKYLQASNLELLFNFLPLLTLINHPSAPCSLDFPCAFFHVVFLSFASFFLFLYFPAPPPLKWISIVLLSLHLGLYCRADYGYTNPDESSIHVFIP